MRITNNCHNVAVLDAAEISYEWLEEHEVPAGKTMMGKQKYEKKTQTKKGHIALPYKSSSYALAPKVR